VAGNDSVIYQVPDQRVETEQAVNARDHGVLRRAALRTLLAQYKHPKYRDNPQWRARLREDIVKTIWLRGGVPMIRAETDVEYERDLFDYPRNKAARVRWTPRSHWFRKRRSKITSSNIEWWGDDRA